MQSRGRLSAAAPRLGRTLPPVARKHAAAVVVAPRASAAASCGSGSEGADARAGTSTSTGGIIGTSGLNTPYPAPTITSGTPAPSSSAPLGQPLAAVAAGGGGGGGGGTGAGGGGGGGGGGNGDNDDDDDEVLLDAGQAEAAALSAKVDLPPDMALAARTVGLRSTALARYAALRGLAVTGALAARFPAVRDRLLADERFLFKVWAECAIDAGCATVAEVRKRGEHFWGEIELYASDLIVGLVLDVVLVTLMAPAAVVGGKGVMGAAAAALGKAGKNPQQAGGVAAAARALLARVPSAVFAPSVPGGARFTPASRVACLAVKFLEYSLAGIVCGLIGQAAANGLIVVKRGVQRGQRDRAREAEAAAAAVQGPKALKAYEERRRREDAAQAAAGDPLDAPLPPVVGTALVWGIFMGVSSNLRYQAVFGVERLVGESAAARRLPALAAATTVAVRFVNNVVGGEQFIDFARYFGVQ